jgi:hypothetical protein
MQKFLESGCGRDQKREQELQEAFLKLERDEEDAPLNMIFAIYNSGRLLSFLVADLSDFLKRYRKSSNGLDDICVAVKNKFLSAGGEKLIEDFFNFIQSNERLSVPPPDQLKFLPIDRDIDVVFNMPDIINSYSLYLAERFFKIEVAEEIQTEGEIIRENVFYFGENSDYPKICIRFDSYNENGIADKGGYYCYTRNREMSVGIRQKTIFEAIFHEFNHALFFYENRRKQESSALKLIYMSVDNFEKMVSLFIWNNDEEFLNILGLSYNDNRWLADSVCCAAFGISEAEPNNLSRCFHSKPEETMISASTPKDRIPLESKLCDTKKVSGFMRLVYY